MKIYHFVGRAGGYSSPFDSANIALTAWRGLKRIFPNVLAAVLMPNHFHVLACVQKPEREQIRLQRLLGSLTRWYRLSSGFEPLPSPEAIEKAEKVQRAARYVFLNPCRAGLCKDPLQWRWSSYRQHLGLSYGQWTDIHPALLEGCPGSGWRESFHRYVSSDPSVGVEGSPFPSLVLAVKKGDPCRVSVAELLEAARAAHPEEESGDSSVIRASFIRLAVNQGWASLSLLSRVLATSRSAVQYWAMDVPYDDRLLVERYCLGDRRLRLWLTAKDSMLSRDLTSVHRPVPSKLV